MSWRGQPFYDTVTSQYFLRIPGTVETAETPWGPNTYIQSQSDWTWVNGSGTTPSTLTLNELVVGTATNGEKITITKRTTPGGEPGVVFLLAGPRQGGEVAGVGTAAHPKPEGTQLPGTLQKARNRPALPDGCTGKLSPRS